MKVKLKDIKSNPYRNIEHYPISPEKVEALKKSIEKTGWWENLIGREVDGEIQIAYGHHRISALRQIKNENFEFNLPIKNLDDGTMIQIMANENMQEWSHSIGVVDETVKVAKGYLELAFSGKNKSESKGRNDYKEIISANDIANFLGWNQSKVSSSLKRLNLIDEGVIEKETIEALPTETHAVEFAQAIKKSNVDFTPQEQKEIVQEIVDSGEGKRKVKERVEAKAFEKKYPNAGKSNDKKDVKSNRVMQFEQWINKAKHDVQGINETLKDFEGIVEQFKDVNDDNVMNRAAMVLSLEKMQKRVSNILNLIKQ